MTKPSSSFSVLSALGTVAAGAGSLAALLDTSQCLHSRIVGGSQILAQKMADALGPAVVQLASPVHRIQWSTSESERSPLYLATSPPSNIAAVQQQQHHHHDVTVTTARGSTRARCVIVALPPNIVHTITFHPSLPNWRSNLHAALPQGNVIKILVVYSTPFWREFGLAGEGFAPHSCSIIKEIYDNTPPSGSPGVICSFIVGDAAARAAAAPGGVTTQGFRDMVLQGLCRFLGPAALNAGALVACDWSAEKWTGGGYCGTFGLGGIVAHGSNRDRSVGPLHFAATELAGVGHMHMEGALRSGMAAAAAARAGVRTASKL